MITDHELVESSFELALLGERPVRCACDKSCLTIQ